MANLPQDEQGNLIVRIGHSPDPDDAFMFHAMTTNAFPTPGYNFVHELQDIETLNHRAMNCELEVSAVSIHAYPDIAENYALMNCGASMGEGYGPMIVAKQGLSLEDAKSSVIAVPGLKTSAYLGLRLAWGDVSVEVVPFDEIIPRILDDTYACGLIIHEGQLTYVEHDLNVLIDLGVWWNERTGGWPMPLGGNVVRRDLGEKVMEDITMYTKMSIEHSIAHPDEALEFAKAWGRGIDDETNQKFVTMYVNDRTIDYKPEGRSSIRRFLQEGQELGMISEYGSVDPAPASESEQLDQLRNTLLDENEKMFQRMRSVFKLRNIRTPQSCLAICDGFSSSSALLRHELAYVLGQMQMDEALPTLIKILSDDKEHVMVRHEAAEALGAIGNREAVPVLEKYLNDEHIEVSESCEVALDLLNWVSNSTIA